MEKHEMLSLNILAGAMGEIFDGIDRKTAHGFIHQGFDKPTHGRGDICARFFKFARQLKQKPVAIVAKVGTHVQAHLDSGNGSEFSNLVEKINVDGNYLNIFYKIEYMAQIIDATLEKGNSFVDARKLDKPERVMVEYSQPNSHKAFHVGHMRNCAIGELLRQNLSTTWA
eukprot:TRINITY_DN2695_c0_g1_i1.p2 TRINITY_DN2695_c0_g1~~TRINITY_DN2695_c0_g1_i1.p2  ORF type:complete len:170 (+),score=35.27 TRINITY_DN2695_c0_g1_i1:194-703(+)